MDYTTLTRVKLEANINEDNDDVRLAALITTASRAIDRKLTGVSTSDSDNYLELGDVTDELLTGRIDANGNIICYPHKIEVSSVTAFGWRWKPSDSWTGISAIDKVYSQGPKVEAYSELCNPTRRIFVRLSYTGGLADDPANLPDDIQDAATVLTIRYWREAQSGLNDSIGVAELGELIYTKAIPVRVVDMLQPYMRVVPWQAI